MSNDDDSTALHEASHAVVARKLGLIVVRAVAAGDDPHVRTRLPHGGRTRAEEIDAVRRLAIVDLAGAVVEDDPASPRAKTDRWNAFACCRRVIALEDHADPDRLHQTQLDDAAKLYQRLADQAATLVHQHQGMIGRLAHHLADLGEMTGPHIDAVLLANQAS